MVEVPGTLIGENGIEASSDAVHKILNWFCSASASQRLELSHAILLACAPLEIRFLGTCLEELLRRDQSSLRETERLINEDTIFETEFASHVLFCNGSRAESDVAEMAVSEDDIDNSDLLCSASWHILNNAHTRGRLLLRATLLRSSNTVGGFRLGHQLVECAPAAFILMGKCISGAKCEVADEVLLLYSMVARHPAIGFLQRLYLAQTVVRLRHLLRDVKPHGAYDASNASGDADGGSGGSDSSSSQGGLSSSLLSGAISFAHVVSRGSGSNVGITSISNSDTGHKHLVTSYQNDAFNINETGSNPVYKLVSETESLVVQVPPSAVEFKEKVNHAYVSLLCNQIDSHPSIVIENLSPNNLAGLQSSYGIRNFLFKNNSSVFESSASGNIEAPIFCGTKNVLSNNIVSEASFKTGRGLSDNMVSKSSYTTGSGLSDNVVSEAFFTTGNPSSENIGPRVLFRNKNNLSVNTVGLQTIARSGTRSDTFLPIREKISTDRAASFSESLCSLQTFERVTGCMAKSARYLSRSLPMMTSSCEEGVKPLADWNKRTMTFFEPWRHHRLSWNDSNASCDRTRDIDEEEDGEVGELLGFKEECNCSKVIGDYSQCLANWLKHHRMHKYYESLSKYNFAQLLQLDRKKLLKEKFTQGAVTKLMSMLENVRVDCDVFWSSSPSSPTQNSICEEKKQNNSSCVTTQEQNNRSCVTAQEQNNSSCVTAQELNNCSFLTNQEQNNRSSLTTQEQNHRSCVTAPEKNLALCTTGSLQNKKTCVTSLVTAKNCNSCVIGLRRNILFCATNHEQSNCHGFTYDCCEYCYSTTLLNSHSDDKSLNAPLTVPINYLCSSVLRRTTQTLLKDISIV